MKFCPICRGNLVPELTSALTSASNTEYLDVGKYKCRFCKKIFEIVELDYEDDNFEED